MAYLLSHSAALLLVVFGTYLPGLMLERTFASGVRLGSLRSVARIVLGLGFWITCAFLMATFGLLQRWTLWTVAAAVTLWALVSWLRSGRRIRRPPLPSSSALAPLALLAAILVPAYLLAMSPPVSWDAGTYHLTLPRLFVAVGGFREVPLNVYSYWPLNVQLLFALAMLAQDYVLAKLLHFALGAATLFALYAGCRAGHRPASGWLAMPLLLANGVIAYQLRVAYVDLGYAFLLLAGFLFLNLALDREPRALWLAGLCCGLAAGVKVTGIAGATIVGALYLPRLVATLRRGEGSELRKFLTRFVAPVLALWLPWLVRAAYLTGNPFYPLLYQRFGGPDWSAGLSARLQAWQSSIGMGREPTDYLLLPVRAILAGGRGYQRFDGELAAFWIVLTPLALWLAWRVPLARRCLGVAGLYFIYWALSSQQMRFLIPALPLLAIAGAVAIVELIGRLPASRRRIALAAAFGAATLFVVATQARVLAAGYRTLGVYWTAQGDLRQSAVHPVYSFVNDQLPADARLLMLNTNQRFFCHREVLADSFFEASQIAEWLSPAADVATLRRLLAERGISHLLIENRPRGIPFPASLGDLLADPGSVDRLYTSKDGKFTVLGLRPGESE